MEHLVKTTGLLCFLTLLVLSHGQSLPREARTKIMEAVVQIVPADNESGELVDWSGSGTIISPQGYILTNFHVIGDPETRQYSEWHGIFVTRPNAADQPPQQEYWAQYVTSDPATDLAILKIEEFANEEQEPVPDTLTFPAVPVGDSNTLIPGDLITVVGYPGISGATITFTAGLMSGWLGEDFESGGKQWIKTDAKIARGNSGGAAFNERGELIGVPTSGNHVLEGTLHEEQLYVRPIGVAWALIGPNVPALVGADNGGQTTPTAASGNGSYGTLTIGSSRSNTIAAPAPGDGYSVYHSYVVEVPAGTSQLVVEVDGNGYDLDLAAKVGSAITSYEAGQLDFKDFSTNPNPRYVINNPDLGTLHVEVVNRQIDQLVEYEVTVTAEGAATSPQPSESARAFSGVVENYRGGPAELVATNDEGAIIGIGRIEEEGRFSVGLFDDLRDENLLVPISEAMLGGFDGCNVTISDEATMSTVVYDLKVVKEGEHQGNIEQVIGATDAEAEPQGFVIRLYSDRDVVVNGTCTLDPFVHTYALNLQRGWNTTVGRANAGGSVSFVKAMPPSDAHWFFTEFGVASSEPSPNKSSQPPASDEASQPPISGDSTQPGPEQFEETTGAATNSSSENSSQPGSEEHQTPEDEPPPSEQMPDFPPPGGPFEEPPPSTVRAYLLTVPSGSVERHLQPGVVQLEHVQGNVTLIAHVMPQSGLFGAATEELSTVRQALTQGQPMHPIDQPARLDYPHLAGTTVAQWYEQEREAGLAHGLFLLHVGGKGNGIVFDVFTPGSAQEADDWELLSDYANELMNHLKAK